MKNSALAFALLLAACHEEGAVSFGLDFRVIGSAAEAQSAQLCTAPGAYHGSVVASSIDDWEIDEPPPHLFLEAYPDGEQNVYRIQVYSASEREADGIWWEPSEILAERTYDAAFGENGGRDSFVVDFEDQRYTVEVQGLPPDAACP
jgi:hypothetical protein